MDNERVTVVKEFRFEAAHYLPDYDGPCKNLHGHSYVLQIGFAGEVDPKTGMVADFSKIKYGMSPVIEVLDHSLLNSVEGIGFPSALPTAESMVVWLKRSIQERLEKEMNSKLVFVRLYETPTSYAEWRA